MATPTSPSAYAFSSRDYLDRAKARLEEGTHEAMFYAALELRCGVEQRLREHLEFQDHVADRLKGDWQIANLGRTADRALHLVDRVAEMTFVVGRTGEVIGPLYYTPVTTALRADASRLGNYLHASREYHKPGDPWWEAFKILLDRVYLGLARANVGSLYGPPLKETLTGRVHTPMLLDDSSKPLRVLGVGTNYKVRIKYLDSLPPELEPAI